MNYYVNYTYSGVGTIHVAASSKEEAKALVKEMWENSEIITEDEDIDPDTFEVVDVQPEDEEEN